MKRYWGWLSLAGVLLFASAALGQPYKVVDTETCLSCHEDTVENVSYMESVHGGLACTTCHAEMADLDGHMEGEVMGTDVACSQCHQQVDEKHAGSVHSDMGIGCTSCHYDIHAQQPGGGTSESIMTACSSCHDTESYAHSIHGQSALAGNDASPSCESCHGLHEVQALSPMSVSEKRAFATDTCISCHENEHLMEENGVYSTAVETYLDSYHGKTFQLGFTDRAAGCADCHGAHNVLPQDDEDSMIHTSNLTQTCSECHPGSTAQFAKFYSHGDYSDSENYPLLYWTFLGMTGLLVSTFAVFWLHSILWMFRGFVENRKKHHAKEAALLDEIVPAGSVGAAHAASLQHVLDMEDAHKPMRRFKKRHILLHITVIVSFLGLSLTGLPLKFADQGWAQVMMSFFGGPYYAGLIHRACAILTFYYFLGAIILSIDFLFVRKDIKGNPLQRLFGPDSLMPNFRDVKDVYGMVRWFFFRGPKPTFDRWTYWEKFDFIAVFWGMFAIGGSGLLLWFPEFFGQALPGWMFNVATIVHSDEALLATGFIFTVHFFNTHMRPEKFPMDFVIFNGEMSKEEFMEERGDQYKRMEAEGRLDELEVKKSSGVLYDFLLKGFGFLAFFTGLALAILMVLAFVSGSH